MIPGLLLKMFNANLQSVFLDFLNTATVIVYRYWRYTVLSWVVCILI